jgi:aminoacrylate hydrolase
MIAVDGRTLSYEVVGAGPPIVFIAGLGDPGNYWTAQIADFSATFQVVTFDHGGVGASAARPPYRVEQWAADTLHLIDHLRLDRVHLVGHSTGGAIAQTLAGNHGDRVASLVLGGSWGRLDARLRQLFMFRKRSLYEQVGLDQRNALGDTPQEIAAARIEALLAYDAAERPPRIRNPTLLIAAADDLLVPWQLSARMAEEISQAHFIKLDRGGHHFPQAQAKAYNASLLEFFRTHAASVGRIRLAQRNASPAGATRFAIALGTAALSTRPDEAPIAGKHVRSRRKLT